MTPGGQLPPDGGQDDGGVQPSWHLHGHHDGSDRPDQPLRHEDEDSGCPGEGRVDERGDNPGDGRLVLDGDGSHGFPRKARSGEDVPQEGRRKEKDLLQLERGPPGRDRRALPGEELIAYYSSPLI